MESGNNGQVFLAQGFVAGDGLLGEESAAASRGKERHEEDAERRQPPPPLVHSPQRGWGGAGSVSRAEETYMALKLVSSSSRHVQREICCLKYLDDFRFGLSNAARDKFYKTSSAEDGKCRADGLSLACSLPPPSPRLFFSQEVGKCVAIGLELLGPDLFAFTEAYVLHEEELCLVGIELLRALRAIHQRGVIHRSIKPENFCWNPNDFLNKDTFKDVSLPLMGDMTQSMNSASAFMFKIIDYGRSTIHTAEFSSTASLYERPYGGWWYSLRGFLGKPMGQKDDLMGVVHTIGYLIDDYSRSGASSSASSRSPSAEEARDWTRTADTTTSATSSGANACFLVHDSSVGGGALTTCPTASSGCFGLQEGERKRSESARETSVASEQKTSAPRCHSYSSWRRWFADKIAKAYRKASKQYRKLHRGEKKDVSHAESKSLDAVQRREARRCWVVRYVETNDLPGLLPDRYYPPNMPSWWVRWFASCNAWCADDEMSAEEMTMRMMRELQQQLERTGENVGDVWRSLRDLYLRYQKKKERGGEEGEEQGTFEAVSENKETL